MKNILVVSATEMETAFAAAKWKENPAVHFAATGVGMVAATYHLTELLQKLSPDFVLFAGIAGCFDIDRILGEVLVVGKEYFGSCGVEENGHWQDIADMGFRPKNGFPFVDNALFNNNIEAYNLLRLPVVNAITVDEITTKPEKIELLRQKYFPVAESMEGAAWHYVCLENNIPFLQLRSLSNYVGERDKKKWEIKNAVQNLNDTLDRYLLKTTIWK